MLFSNKPGQDYWGVFIPSAMIAHMKWCKQHPKATLQERVAEHNRLKQIARDQYNARKAAGFKEFYSRSKTEAEAYAARVKEACGFDPEVQEVSFL